MYSLTHIPLVIDSSSSSHSIRILFVLFNEPLLQISQMLPQLGNFLFSDDVDILSNVLSALALVLPGVPEPNVCKRLVQLLG